MGCSGSQIKGNVYRNNARSSLLSATERSNKRKIELTIDLQSRGNYLDKISFGQWQKLD